MIERTYRIPESVVEDTHAYRREVEKFMAGDTSPVAFRAIRVPMGIYEQRENDTYMVRVRGAAGLYLPEQVKTITDLSEEFGDGVIHVTTRQDLQIHHVLIQNTPCVLERLLESGLSSRGGGGNTVRNVSACPSAGICPDELFDVTPYALALTEYLTANRANFNLPRKFKCAFSGCGTDCGLASVADLGFFAHVRDGVQGFSVYAGGGMGARSAVGVLIEEFIPAQSIFEVAESVKRVFDSYGDRTNRHKARLRFVVERFGAEGFRKLYLEELDRVRQEGVTTPEISFKPIDEPSFVSVIADEPTDAAYSTWKKKNASPQKQEGLFSVNVPLQLGNIVANELRALADLAEEFGDGTLRTSQLQDLQLRGIPEFKLSDLYRELRKINETFVDVHSVRCVACAGASTCKLGLCLSRGLATALEAELDDVDIPFDTAVRISGCPNSCGHHPIAAIGLFGGAVRENGRLAPAYSIVAGGRLSEGESRLSKFITRVPARAVPELLKEFWIEAARNRLKDETLDQLLDRCGIDFLRELGERYQSIPSYEDTPAYYRDFGSEEDFSLAGRGPGECGAGVTDVITLDIDEAKNKFEKGLLYDAVVAGARALLITRGLEPKKDREIFAAFSEHLIAPGWVGKNVQDILDSAVDYKLGDRSSLDDLREDIQALVERVNVLFKSLDSNLSFRAEPIEDAVHDPETSDNGADEELDLRGVACPMNFVRAKIQLEQIEVGQVLDVLLDRGEPARNVPASFADQGQEVLSVNEEDQHFRVRIKRIS